MIATRAGAVFLWVALTARAAAGQERPEPPRRFIALADWGLSDVAAVRSGQVRLVRHPVSPRLDVYALSDAPLRAVPWIVRSEAPAFTGNSFLIADFVSGNRNRLGGVFNDFERSPSDATAGLAHAPDGRRALRLVSHKAATGFCGLWIHVFDAERPPDARLYLDVRAFSTLSFWIRGDRGGEALLLKVADAAWERREDALPIGEVATFLPGGRIETQWRQAVIPLSRLPDRIDRGSLASLVLEVTAPGASVVYLSGLSLSVHADSLPPLPEPPMPAALRPLHRATWVWHTAELLAYPDRQQAWLDFLREAGIDRVFLQLPDSSPSRGRPGDIAFAAAPLRPLVAALHAAGMVVYALDGDPRYALPALHPAVLATVERVIRYNRESPVEARFDGIRHDIEPYRLPGFTGPRRETILRGLLGLAAASARRAHAAGLRYGVDIPFWYDAPDERTYEAVWVEFAGRLRPASEHLIDVADDVAVMDYRTTAYGADGTIRHAEGELAYAAGQGKDVYVGLETNALPDEELLDWSGAPRRGLPTNSGDVVALVPGRDSTEVLVAGRRDLARWLARTGTDPKTLVWWPVRGRVRVPGDRLSFARLGSEALERVAQATATELQHYRSLAGFALHDVRGYRDLRGAGPEGR